MRLRLDLSENYSSPLCQHRKAAGCWADAEPGVLGLAEENKGSTAAPRQTDQWDSDSIGPTEPCLSSRHCATLEKGAILGFSQ